MLIVLKSFMIKTTDHDSFSLQRTHPFAQLSSDVVDGEDKLELNVESRNGLAYDERAGDSIKRQSRFHLKSDQA